MPKQSIAKKFALITTIAIVALAILIGWATTNTLYAWLASINIVTFTLYAWDKRQARISRLRVPEIVLHLTALAGGSIGALIAQRLFHHKTKKLSFQIIFICTIIAQLTLLFILWQKDIL